MHTYYSSKIKGEKMSETSFEFEFQLNQSDQKVLVDNERHHPIASYVRVSLSSLDDMYVYVKLQCIPILKD